MQFQDYETKADEVKTAIGLGDILEADLSYMPTKYKNHSRLHLTDLENAVDQRPGYDYRPSDECGIEVLIPDNWGDGEGFYVKVMIHCDQSGGFALMECRNL